MLVLTMAWQTAVEVWCCIVFTVLKLLICVILLLTIKLMSLLAIW